MGGGGFHNPPPTRQNFLYGEGVIWRRGRGTYSKNCEIWRKFVKSREKIAKNYPTPYFSDPFPFSKKPAVPTGHFNPPPLYPGIFPRSCIVTAHERGRELRGRIAFFPSPLNLFPMKWGCWWDVGWR